LAASREPESAGPVAGTGGGRGPSHGLAFRLPEMVRSLHTGGHMWKLPHAGSVSEVVLYHHKSPCKKMYNKGPPPSAWAGLLNKPFSHFEKKRAFYFQF